MTYEQLVLFVILAATLFGFVWNYWRYDIVAGLALMLAVYAGIVPAKSAFDGFAHPAVITVGAVLVISRALQNTGIVDRLVRLLAPTRRTTTLQVGAGSGLVLLLSAVMNNVGALALMLPVTIRNAARARRSVSLLLIPLSFASLLGGMITLIGTPPNLVIASFREDYTGQAFGMFDFTPVGGVVALAGLVYLTLIGWRLLPDKNGDTEAARFRRKIDAFVAEVRVPEGSPFDDVGIGQLEDLCENEITVMAIHRDGERIYAPHSQQILEVGDILVVQGDPSIWEPLCDGKRFDLLVRGEASQQALATQAVALAEAVVMPNSPLIGRSARRIRMHDNFGINLLAVARQSNPTISRLKNTKFEVGDVLLMQGERERLERTLANIGCLILADRGSATASIGYRAWIGFGIFGFALLTAASGLASAPIALVSAAIAMVIARIVSLQEVYDSIEWPIIMLLGALIPLDLAMKTTGAASIIASSLINIGGGMPVWATIAIILVVSMWLSDLIHNTPTAVLMAPVAAGIAEGLQLSVDPFLMAVAVGSASAFLTPIGHQSNTLVMGPGGYNFTDYARVGAPLQVIILMVAVPAIVLVWM
ncbi:MAG: di/tricarboxylate transporter [Hyphomicrobiaceae bacterium]|jgi:di/tricarboxylate transporter